METRNSHFSSPIKAIAIQKGSCMYTCDEGWDG